jgi:RimJ/RimL family protein N-acetyltransferase
MDDLSIHKVPGAVWNTDQRNRAFQQVFRNERPNMPIDCDFALVIMYGGKPGGYIECAEQVDGALMWLLGGGTPEHQNSTLIFEGYQRFLNWSLGNFRAVRFLVEEQNYRMIRLSHRLGFRINGLVLVEGQPVLRMELSRETFANAKAAA